MDHTLIRGPEKEEDSQMEGVSDEGEEDIESGQDSNWGSQKKAEYIDKAGRKGRRRQLSRNVWLQSRRPTLLAHH